MSSCVFRIVYCIAFILLSTCLASAQQDTVRTIQDTTKVKSNRVVSSSVQRADSTRKNISKNIADRKNKADSILHSSDSLRLVKQVKHQHEKIDSAHQRINSKLDSIQAKLNVNTILQNAQSKVLDKMDSARQGILRGKDDSLRQKLAKPGEVVNNVMDKARESVDKVMNPFAENGATMPTLPSVPGISNTSMPTPDVSVKGLAPNSNLKLPEMQGATLPNIPQPDLNITSDVSGRINEEVVAGKGKVNELVPLDGLNEIKEKTEVLQSTSQKIEAVKQEGIGKVAEESIANAEPVKAMSKELSEADKLKQYYDPEVAKEELLNKAKMEAVNHFAGHEQELVAVMEKLSAAKAKVPDPEGIIDLFAKRQNTQRDKKWHQRLVYGVDLQMQKPSAFWLDINPYIYYKISDKYRAGAGWNIRRSYNFEDNEWIKKEYMYGPRATFEWNVKKGFAFKADIECMNAIPPSRIISGQRVEYTSREWTWSYFAGIKRSFAFSEFLKGNVQMLYNLYDPKKQSPYANRLNVRIGFEFSKPKKTKK